MSILGPGKDSDPKRNNVAPIDGQQQFERPNAGQEDSFKVVFPRSAFVPVNSRHVRFPTERHSIHGINSAPSAPSSPSAAESKRIRSIVVFPRSDMKSENELPTVNVENPSMDPTISIALQSKETNEPFVPNSVNNSVFVANETAIENGFEPMIYIDDDGVFQVKYVAKGEHVLASNDKQPHSNGLSLASKKAEETAIISNDNRQIPQDHRIPNKDSSTTIDLIDSNATVNNIVMNGAHTKSPSSGEQQQQQQKQQPKPSSGNKHSRDFSGQLIFV